MKSNSYFLRVLGCTRAKALGMEDGVIRDKQITASSEYSSNHQASNGRLNFNAKKGAWSAKTIDLNQWLQVDFQRSTIITGISTQGRIQYSQFVTSYTISFSDDENNFQSVKAAGIQKVKRGEEIAKVIAPDIFLEDVASPITHLSPFPLFATALPSSYTF